MKNFTRSGSILTALVFIFSALMTTSVAASETGEIQIGYTAPFTGAAAEYGNNGWRGILLALEDINKEGISIGGKNIKLEFPNTTACALPMRGSQMLKR